MVIGYCSLYQLSKYVFDTQPNCTSVTRFVICTAGQSGDSFTSHHAGMRRVKGPPVRELSEGRRQQCDELVPPNNAPAGIVQLTRSVTILNCSVDESSQVYTNSANVILC